MKFEFKTAGRIIFGQGSSGQIGELASTLGSRAFVFTGHSSERAAPLFSVLKKAGITFSQFSMPEEPTIDLLKQGLLKAREQGSDLVIGFGGGAAIDSAKAIAALTSNSGDLMDYLEVIGKAQPLENKPLPCIAIPTTAGTGAEVTSNAVLKSPDHGVKVSLRSPFMFPDIAVVDPELSLSMPPSITTSTGMDALTQLIEAFTSRRANPMTDSLCIEGIERGARSLKLAYDEGNNLEAREDMSLASMFSGIALSNAGLGAVHGIAGPLGGMCRIPHGAACAALLPHVIEINVRALKERDSESPILDKYRKLSVLITGRTSATVEDMVEWLHRLHMDLNIKPLSQYCFSSDQVPELIDHSQKASSMKANPIILTSEELREIIEKALGTTH